MSRTSTGRVRRGSCRRRAASPRLAPGAALHHRRVVDVDAFERGRETVGIAFAPHLAVGDDVDAGALHVADRDQRGVVLRLLEKGSGTRHISFTRTRGTVCDLSTLLSTSQSGCG